MANAFQDNAGRTRTYQPPKKELKKKRKKDRKKYRRKKNRKKDRKPDKDYSTKPAVAAPDPAGELARAATGSAKNDSVGGSVILAAGGDPIAGAKTATPANRPATLGTVTRLVDAANRSAPGGQDPNLPSGDSLRKDLAAAGASLSTPIERVFTTTGTSDATTTTVAPPATPGDAGNGGGNVSPPNPIRAVIDLVDGTTDAAGDFFEILVPGEGDGNGVVIAGLAVSAAFLLSGGFK